MSTDDTNPYQASATDPKPPAGPLGSMEYMRAVNYVFESPKWTMNLVWGGLCILSTQVIPVVGQLLWIGYQFEVVEDLFCSPPKKGYLDFDLNRFKEYLLRGLWIFLVMLVVMLVTIPIIMVLFAIIALIIGVIGAATGGDEGAMTIGVMVMIAIGIVALFVFMIFMTIVMTPLTLRAGLTQDFRASFDIAWIKDFVGKMWVDTILAQLFLMAVGVLAYVLGLLACIIGIFPAVAFIFLAQGHLYLQLYQVYLSRGGQKIPLKSTTPFQPAK